MAYNQINIEPAFKQSTVPCEGEVGDLFVMTRFAKDEDDTPTGQATLWFCTKAAVGERHAVWAEVSFDGIARCDSPVPDPNVNRPEVHQV